MFKKALIVTAMSTFVSTSAFSSELSDFGNELHAAKGEITSIVSAAQGSVGQPDSGSDPVTNPGSGWEFNDDARAVPLYESAAITFGNGGSKFLEADFLYMQGRYAESAVKKAEACADVNIALVDLSVANHYAAQPGFSMVLLPFSPQLKNLYDKIRARRGVICI